MAKPGRRPVLDEMKKREILAILAVGCSRRTAAAYVGCAPSTITNELQRDKVFAAEIERRESGAEIGFVRNIQDAAKDAKSWRAAAWFLERRYPEEFGRKKQDAIGYVQINALLFGLAEILAEEVPAGEFRKNMLKRLQRMMGDFFRDLSLWQKMSEKEAAEGGEYATPANDVKTAEAVGGDE